MNQSVPGGPELLPDARAAAWLLLAGTVGAWATPTAHTRRHGRIQKIQKKMSGADAFTVRLQHRTELRSLDETTKYGGVTVCCNLHTVLLTT